MVNLRIPRTATFAWAEGSSRPLIATGTVAGAVSADFSSDSHLELWDLDLDSGVSDALELTPKVSISTEKRFHDIVWGTRGLIAGGLEDGSLNLWNAESLLNGNSETPEVLSKHTDAINTLQFNPSKNELLLAAGRRGEMSIWDLNNTSSAFFLGQPPQGTNEASLPEYTTVDWNKKIAHILLSGGKNTLVKVWDVRQKKESLSLSHLGRREISAVAWHPENSTKLLTALPDNSNPVIMVWDLRNANAPEKTLAGHDQGVLSLDWCKQDPDILLSSGQDNRTICWNPNSGEKLGEFPIGTNWMFRTRFNPKNPSFMASASYDGKISIQALQSSSQSSKTDSTAGSLSGEDFFNQASFDPQGPSFSLKQAPRWYKRPVGASFGFGGKLVSFRTPDFSTGQHESSVKVEKVAVEPEVGGSMESFENALKAGNFATLCDKKIEESPSDAAKAEWTILKTLFDASPKKQITELLGFTSDISESTADETETLQVNGAPKDEKNALSFFGESGEDDDAFLSGLSTKDAHSNNPFNIFTGSESEADKKITRALIRGDFESAVDVCIKEDRLSDAFMLAVAGGQGSLQKVQKAYFAKKSERPNYLRVLESVVGKNLWDVVHNADLADWKEVLCTICTFADDKEFPELCEALGERLEDDRKINNEVGKRQDAATCYLSGSNLEKIVQIWLEEYKENEAANLEDASAQSSAFSIHVQSLQELIEKVTVFREATKFVDSDINATAGWKLAPLYDIYCEYADILANQGQLDAAAKYLNLVSVSYPAAEIARNRVKIASGQVAQKKPVTTTRQTLPTTGPRTQTRSPFPSAGAAVPSQAPTTMFNPGAAQTASIYTPPTQQQPQSSMGYTPQASTQPAPTPSRYTPAQATTSVTGYGAQPGYQSGYSSFAPQPVATPYGAPPPPPMGGTSNTPPVPSAQKEFPKHSWNDLDESMLPANKPRRTTPAPTAPVMTPFPNAQPGVISPTNSGPPFGGPPPRSGTPGSLPPPPKAGQAGAGIPRGMSPATVGGQYRSQTPSSQMQSAYAPQSPPQAQSRVMPTPPPPSSSAYAQPPKAAGPPTSRYTPQPSAQAQSMGPGPGMGRGVGPPSSGIGYAPPPMGQQMLPPASQFQGPPPTQGPPMTAPPPMGPPRGSSATGSRPGTSQSGGPPKAATPASKYPKGDRSHIPESSQLLYSILNEQMEIVTASAPAEFRTQVQQMGKRLDSFFDHLNNDDLCSPATIQQLTQTFTHVKNGNFEAAAETQSQISQAEIGSFGAVLKKLVQLSQFATSSSQRAY